MNNDEYENYLASLPIEALVQMESSIDRNTYPEKHAAIVRRLGELGWPHPNDPDEQQYKKLKSTLISVSIIVPIVVLLASQPISSRSGRYPMADIVMPKGYDRSRLYCYSRGEKDGSKSYTDCAFFVRDIDTEFSSFRNHLSKEHWEQCSPEKWIRKNVVILSYCGSIESLYPQTTKTLKSQHVCGFSTILLNPWTNATCGMDVKKNMTAIGDPAA